MIEHNKDDEKSANEFVYSLEEKRLLKKINWTTAPFICSIVFLQVYK